MTLCLIGLMHLIAADFCLNLGLGLILSYLGLWWAFCLIQSDILRHQTLRTARHSRQVVTCEPQFMKSVQTPTSCNHVESWISQHRSSLFFLPTTMMNSCVSWWIFPPASMNSLLPPPWMASSLPWQTAFNKQPLLSMNGLLPVPPSLDERPPPSLNEWPSLSMNRLSQQLASSWWTVSSCVPPPALNEWSPPSEQSPPAFDEQSPPSLDERSSPSLNEWSPPSLNERFPSLNGWPPPSLDEWPPLLMNSLSQQMASSWWMSFCMLCVLGRAASSCLQRTVSILPWQTASLDEWPAPSLNDQHPLWMHGLLFQRTASLDKLSSPNKCVLCVLGRTASSCICTSVTHM